MFPGVRINDDDDDDDDDDEIRHQRQLVHSDWVTGVVATVVA